MKLLISKPDDSNTYYETEVKCETFAFPTQVRVGFNRGKKDPIHAGLTHFWNQMLSTRNKGRAQYGLRFGQEFYHIIFINNCPVVLEKKGISLDTISQALARITYKSCFENEASVLLEALYATLNLPENVQYCLENRAPYHFYENYQPINVRLNVVQIDDKMLAMEISDGVWGEITPQELDTYCNYYVHEKARGSWKMLSPRTLYKRLMKKEPTDSELKVMIAFLKQNRMKDIVEARALELVNDLLVQHEGRLVAKYGEDDVLDELYVRGKDYDWKLTNNKYKSGIQMVSTYVYQPTKNDEEEDIELSWKGPICIDNMADGSPLGDQFATRALALLNDSFTITIVSTIKGYLSANPNEYRVDFNEL
jgi:hypothetical protein